MAMKPGPTFKMASSTKTMLALGKFSSKEHRGFCKRMMIDAQLTAAEQSKKKLRVDGKPDTKPE